ncbi:hypothetical protein WCX49_06645 [Sulfurimonas sp. HSL-1656]|uniref:hypothetical protein n=1 Tax=Thiomicrolovo subterrani TaxID=3131934 RepID=UPI0031F86009
MTINDLETNPFFGVVLDFAIENSMEKRRFPSRLVQDRLVMHTNTGNGYETQIAGAVYESNHANGFHLTPSGALRIIKGTARDEDVADLEHDLNVAAESGLFLPDAEAFEMYF